MSNAPPNHRTGENDNGAKPAEDAAQAPTPAPDDDPSKIVDEHRTERPVEDMGGEID